MDAPESIYWCSEFRPDDKIEKLLKDPREPRPSRCYSDCHTEPCDARRLLVAELRGLLKRAKSAVGYFTSRAGIMEETSTIVEKECLELLADIRRVLEGDTE